ncbi:unnamed protein product [Cercospora beticola]|nr:unnamed protein product [Cercospora beticola]
MARLSIIVVLLMGAIGVFANDPPAGTPHCKPPSCYKCSSKARLVQCKQPVCLPETCCQNCDNSRLLLACEKKIKKGTCKNSVFVRAADEEFAAENALDDIEVTM